MDDDTKNHKSEETLDFYLAMGEEPDSKGIPYDLCSKQEQNHRDLDDHLFWIKNYSEDCKNLLLEIKENNEEHYEAAREYMHRADVWLDAIAKRKHSSNHFVLWIIAILLLLILLKT